VSGSVVFDAAFNDNYRPGFGRGATLGGLVLHELGHVIGLAHVNGTDSMMTPRVSDGAGDIGPADAQALRLVGAQAGCRRVPVAPWD
jgi:hypothetical protein